MDIKQYVTFEVTKNDKTYKFTIEPGAGYGEIYDVLFEMLNQTIQLAQQAVNAAAPATQQANTVQEVSPTTEA